ncbi:MAG: ABC transporter substrate-binding protein [Candidatus Midichloria mitochondrii]|uniref:Uncharacterized protein n=1 Tax=Midichloria mitochondrii (strain IricVA) TaxID=696127 RepID=F7XV54_MIDMI|nr:hypothetical protein [Candidatus Midichloria mitochondrii]AEI88553.1 hypothetical protein midi_00236 [Candidatus Midichloria mitochondrii IricVA]MDJ1256130.1 hypothetical protein [Candidatus Midichloria mitochondrii]MDJ1287825.1 hypothetical protein [Candidatus Midichloria mitochondrii]MDJ1298673.1 hypothetical protein [Candidatus Midichloria mitochondrii]MDJ1312865.1 hypothetical protein [Candidatus Midichloria mitochondrii]
MPDYPSFESVNSYLSENPDLKKSTEKAADKLAPEKTTVEPTKPKSAIEVVADAWKEKLEANPRLKNPDVYHKVYKGMVSAI